MIFFVENCKNYEETYGYRDVSSIKYNLVNCFDSLKKYISAWINYI